MTKADQRDRITSRFLFSGIIEGYSYLLLFFVAMPLKYYGDQPEYVKWIGLIHGILVLVYVFFLAQMHLKLKLSLRKTLIAFILSLVPFGTFFLRHVLRQKGS